MRKAISRNRRQHPARKRQQDSFLVRSVLARATKTVARELFKLINTPRQKNWQQSGTKRTRIFQSRVHVRRDRSGALPDGISKFTPDCSPQCRAIQSMLTTRCCGVGFVRHGNAWRDFSRHMPRSGRSIHTEARRMIGGHATFRNANVDGRRGGCVVHNTQFAGREELPRVHRDPWHRRTGAVYRVVRAT